VSGFTGFPDAALDFYDDLEIDNSKSFWEAHRHIYEESVKAPMVALTAALEPEFGTAKVFRPYRDVRFAKDKTPYKNHQGAFVAAGPATGWYVEIGAPGMRVGGGFYEANGTRLTALRDAIVAEKPGRELARLVATYEKDGWEIGGDRLKTTPRGYDPDHPRIDLLRHKQLFVGKPYGFDGLDTPDLLDRVREDWRALRPLVEWLTRYGGGADSAATR
jgi:uncharacterized protein (TIGR02453 family)